MNIEALKIVRENCRMGYTLTFADAMLIQHAIDAAMLKAGPVAVKCPKCGDTGLADSGGVQPWGEPINIPCDCTVPVTAATVPDGWKLVPVEPTAEMYDAGDMQLATKQVWDAMLAVAPAAPEQEV